MMGIRRSVMANGAHQATESGSLVHFSTNLEAPMEITGSGNVTVCGKNLFDENYANIGEATRYRAIFVGDNTVTMTTTNGRGSGGGANLFLLAGSVSTGANTNTNGVWSTTPRTVTAVNGYVTVGYRNYKGADPREANTQLEIGTSGSNYAPYSGTTSAALTGRKSLKGINNVFSDNGNTVTVKYWKN